MHLDRSMDRNDPKGIDERSFQFFKDVLTFVEMIRVHSLFVRLKDVPRRDLTFDL